MDRLGNYFKVNRAAFYALIEAIRHLEDSLMVEME